jgi:2-polyprenyl-6-methoxyphenol hydroxylase-like FAD-dependent oxidoreductase
VQEETVDAGIIYYTRYYRIRDGVTLPDGPWIPTPRGDLGYAGYSTFPGDNRTFGAIFAIPPKDKALKILYDERAFEAAARLVPAMWAWCNPDAAEPITGMYAMANIDNMLRHYPSSPVAGLIPIGDAWCHTDPVFALGLSMAIMESAALARAVSEHPNDLRDVAAEYFAACVPEVYERYPWVVAFDEARNRAWEGEPLDPGRRDGANYALFGVGAAMAVALVDPEVFRVAVRRNTFLDRLAVLDDDAALQEQIEKNFAEMRGRRPPPVSRDELLDAAARATR